jgi:hypothetical protein
MRRLGSLTGTTYALHHGISCVIVWRAASADMTAQASIATKSSGLVSLVEMSDCCCHFQKEHMFRWP